MGPGPGRLGSGRAWPSRPEPAEPRSESGSNSSSKTVPRRKSRRPALQVTAFQAPGPGSASTRPCDVRILRRTPGPGAAVIAACHPAQ
jgi:hypothetical protein